MDIVALLTQPFVAFCFFVLAVVITHHTPLPIAPIPYLHWPKINKFIEKFVRNLQNQVLLVARLVIQNLKDNFCKTNTANTKGMLFSYFKMVFLKNTGNCERGGFSWSQSHM